MEPKINISAQAGLKTEAQDLGQQDFGIQGSSALAPVALRILKEHNRLQRHSDVESFMNTDGPLSPAELSSFRHSISSRPWATTPKSGSSIMAADLISEYIRLHLQVNLATSRHRGLFDEIVQKLPDLTRSEELIDRLVQFTGQIVTPLSQHSFKEQLETHPSFDQILAASDRSGGLVGQIRTLAFVPESFMSTLQALEETGIRSSLRYYAFVARCSDILTKRVRGVQLNVKFRALPQGQREVLLAKTRLLSVFDTYPGGSTFKRANLENNRPANQS